LDAIAKFILTQPACGKFVFSGSGSGLGGGEVGIFHLHPNVGTTQFIMRCLLLRSHGVEFV
jgi:hypothetical protein